MYPMDAESCAELWLLCWNVNLAFAVKAGEAGKCVKCNKPYESASWQSVFVSTAVMFHCEHSSTASLCGVCEDGTLVNSLQMGEKCFVPGCQEILNVSPTVIEARLADDPGIRDRQVYPPQPWHLSYRGLG